MDISPLLFGAPLFFVINGANDGATLIAVNLSSKALRPLTALAILVGATSSGHFSSEPQSRRRSLSD